MDWTNDPATEQQLNLLRKLGFVPTRQLSLTEPANLIRQYKKHPPLPVASHAIEPPPRPTDHPAPRAPAPDPKPWETCTGLSARQRFFPLRQTAGPARGAVAGVAGVSDVPSGIAAPTPHRAEFWLDTCREVKEMKVASARVYELR